MSRAGARISMVTACSSSSSMRLSIPGRQRSLALSPAPLLPASVLKLSALPNAVISGLSTFTAGFTRYHCASLAFVPTHQAPHRWCACKARYQTRG